MEKTYFIIRLDTTLEHLKAQKRELSKLHHPDVAGGDETTMSAINIEFELACKKIELRENKLNRISKYEKKIILVNSMAKQIYEPELKEITKKNLLAMVEKYSPKKLKSVLLFGVSTLNPVIDRADTNKIANKLFQGAKFIAKIL